MSKAIGFAVGLLTMAATATITLLVIRHIRPLADLAGIQPATKAVGPEVPAFREVA